MRKLIAGVACAATLAGAQAASAETLTAGVEAAFPPWAYAEQGEYKGIAIDAMRAIAEEQGMDVEFKDLPWPSLVPALAKGRIDILVTGLIATKERAEVLDFTIPWWENDDEVLVTEDSDLNVVTALCCGQTVGAQSGSTQHSWIEANLIEADTGIELRGYEDYVTAVEDMKTGRIDSVVTSTDTAQTLISKGQPIKVIGTIQQNQPLALAVQEGDPENLLAKLNKGILAIAESGKWEEIMQKYQPGVQMRQVPATMPDYIDSYEEPIPGYSD